MCGSGTLTACGASTGAMTDCPSPPASGTNYVDVNTSTKTSGGGTVIAPVFAKELLGNGSYTGTKVLACAQVQWGTAGGRPPRAHHVAFTTSACQWDKATSRATSTARRRRSSRPAPTTWS